MGSWLKRFLRVAGAARLFSHKYRQKKVSLGGGQRESNGGFAVSTGKKKVQKMTIIFSGGVNEISRKWKSVDTRLTRKGFFRGMKKPNCLIFSWVMFDFGVAHSGFEPLFSE